MELLERAKKIVMSYDETILRTVVVQVNDSLILALSIHEDLQESAILLERVEDDWRICRHYIEKSQPADPIFPKWKWPEFNGWN